MEKDDRNPKPSREQDQPAPERPTTLEEDAGMDLQSLKNPPQAEGQRENADDDSKHPGNR